MKISTLTTRDYARRLMSEGYPSLAQLSHQYFSAHQSQSEARQARLNRFLTYLGRLIRLEAGSKMLVVGCGPHPQTVRTLKQTGYDAVGIEPVGSFVTEARNYLGHFDGVLEGSAEHLPVPDGSQQLIFMESVLEHVDSPLDSLKEMLRALQPGGVLYVQTTNRLSIREALSLGEFNVRFFNWLPALVKESYIFQHLHYDPSLANFTERPAVHFFSYGELSSLGRLAGFSQMYSLLDLMRMGDDSVQKSALRRNALQQVQTNPWLRAMALSQFGDSILMVKRGQPYVSIQPPQASNS
ncbi:MAG: class I SAM-dependent methyltransferase [Myxococcota bacterium]